jgi:transposase-like protein
MKKKPLVQNQSTKGDAIIEALPLACVDEKAAVEFMEQQRWGKLPACPLCGDMNVYQMRDSKTGERQANFRWRCRGCKEQFTVRIGTVLEDSRIPFRHWCYAFWRASTSKKGVSALEIHRQTGLCYKSSLFLLHRVRYAMDEAPVEPMKGDVEVDEVFIGGRARRSNNSRIGKPNKKTVVIGIKERGGRVRPRVIADVTGPTLKQAIRDNVHPSARILTDEWSGYRGIGKEFAGGHETVRHRTYEFARGDVSTNQIEGFFGMLRRGLDGIYHSVSRKHLHRYLCEFQFRHDHRGLTDGQRTKHAIRSANGKRLMYRQVVDAVK